MNYFTLFLLVYNIFIANNTRASEIKEILLEGKFVYRQFPYSNIKDLSQNDMKTYSQPFLYIEINEQEKYELFSNLDKKNNYNVKADIMYYTGENFLVNLDQQSVIIKKPLTEIEKGHFYPIAEIDLIRTALSYSKTKLGSLILKETIYTTILEKNIF